MCVVRVVCDGCDWTAGGKSGAFSSVGLAVKSLACLRGHIPCRLSARFADGDVSAAACRACGPTSVPRSGVLSIVV